MISIEKRFLYLIVCVIVFSGFFPSNIGFVFADSFDVNGSYDGGIYYDSQVGDLSGKSDFQVDSEIGKELENNDEVESDQNGSSELENKIINRIQSYDAGFSTMSFGSGGSGGGGGAGRDWPDADGKCWEEVVDNSGPLPVTRLVEKPCPSYNYDDSDLYRQIALLDNRITTLAITIQNIPVDFENALRKFLGADYGGESHYNFFAGDSPIVRVLKGQTSRIVTEVEKIPANFKTYLGADVTSAGHYNSFAGDSPIVRVMKGQTTRVVTEVEKIPANFITYLGADISSAGHYSAFAGDSPIVRVMKGQTTRIVTEVEKISPKFITYLGADISSAGHSNSFAGDSPIVRVMKGQTTRIVTEVEKIPANFITYLGADISSAGHYSAFAGDSPIVRVMKGQTTRIQTAIENNKFVFPASVVQTYNDILIAVKKLDKPEFKIPDSINKLLENIEKAINNIDLVGGDAGTNFWDFLGGLFGDIFDLVEFLIEKVIYLVVPEDSTFITISLSGLSDSLSKKFEPMNMLKNSITSSFQIEEKTFENVRVDLPAFGTVDIFDWTYINMAIPKFRQLLSGMMVLMTAFWAYRKITTEMIK